MVANFEQMTQGVELLTHASIHTLVPDIFAGSAFLRVAFPHKIRIFRVILYESIPATTVLAKFLCFGSSGPLLLLGHGGKDTVLEGHDAVFEENVHLVL